MERKEIIKNLKLIKQLIIDKEEYFDKNRCFDSSRFISNKDTLIEPIKPAPINNKFPYPPTKPNLIVEELKTILDLNTYLNVKKYEHLEIEFNWVLTIFLFFIASCIFLIAFFSEGSEMGLLIIYYVISGALIIWALWPVFPFLYNEISNFFKLQSDKANYKNYVNKLNDENNKIKNRNEENKNVYDNQMIEYNKKLEEYHVVLNKYHEVQRKYENDMYDYECLLDEYNKQKEELYVQANNELNKFNESVLHKAQELFDREFNKLNFDFPEKYYSKIDIIIDILESMRADTLKEAINVMVQDKFERDRINAIEEANSERRYCVKYRYKQIMGDWCTGEKYVFARSAQDAMAMVERSISAHEE